jgi:hypothetical protein
MHRPRRAARLFFRNDRATCRRRIGPRERDRARSVLTPSDKYRRENNFAGPQGRWYSHSLRSPGLRGDSPQFGARIERARNVVFHRTFREFIAFVDTASSFRRIACRPRAHRNVSMKNLAPPTVYETRSRAGFPKRRINSGSRWIAARRSLDCSAVLTHLQHGAHSHRALSAGGDVIASVASSSREEKISRRKNFAVARDNRYSH